MMPRDTYCWDGRSLATDCHDGLQVVIDGQLVTFAPGTVVAIGPLAHGALGALSCGATSQRALEAGQAVAEALTPQVMEATAQEIELQEVQDARSTPGETADQGATGEGGQAGVAGSAGGPADADGGGAARRAPVRPRRRKGRTGDA